MRSIFIFVIMVSIGFTSDEGLRGAFAELLIFPSIRTYGATKGIGLSTYKSKGLGFYMSLSGTFFPKTATYDDVTINTFGDRVVGVMENYSIVNMGVTKRVMNNLGIFMGFGHHRILSITEMYDPFRILGDNGKYYVNSTYRTDDSGMHSVIGAVVSIKRFTFSVQYDSFLRTKVIGIGFKF